MSRAPRHRLAPFPRAAVPLAIALLGLLPQGLLAQIRTDGTLGRPAAALQGPNFLIPESLGRLSGKNLFHSFQAFNVQTGESATFTTTTPGLNNVISRVTGGSPSQINGALSLAAASGTPNFFFINPAGVTFGAGAAVDVPGAFHASTANHLQFADGRFAADPAAASTFSSAAPESFGFLGSTRAPIKVLDGAAVITQAHQALSLVGGDVQVRGGALVGKVGGAGELRIVAVGGGAAQIPIVGSLPPVQGTVVVAEGGSIRSASLEREAAPGGTGAIVVAAGDVVVSDRGEIASFTTSGGKAADLRIEAQGGISLLRGALVESYTFGSGNAGDLLVRGASVTLDGESIGQSMLSSSALPKSTGRAGRVDVTASGDVVVRHASISSATSSGADGGAVTVQGRNITVDGLGLTSVISGISTATLPGSTGKAGALSVTASDSLKILNRAVIDSSTFSAGDASTVKVQAGNILIDGQSGGYAAITSLASSGSRGNAGNVEVTSTGDLTLRNGGQLDSSTYSSGNAGTVRARAASMTIDGLGDSMLPSSVFGVSAPSASGNAGSIDVRVSGALTILGRAAIDSSVYTDGNGGNILVQAGSLLIDGRSIAGAGIRGRTWAPAGRSSGNVDVAVAGNITILNGGLIDSSTQGGADAGAVRVRADSLWIDGQADQDRLTGIFSSASLGSTGHGGSIEVDVAGQATLLSRGEIDSTTYSSGNAGSVKVRAGSLLIEDRGQTGYLTGIFSEATTSSTGNAGSVDVQVQDMLTVRNGGLIDSSTFSSGHAGSVKVRAGRIAIDGGAFGYAAISSTAVPDSAGNAGNIEVSATQDLVITQGGRVESATYSRGDAGVVRVDAATLELDGARSSINASAKTGSHGQTGSVQVQASERISLRHGARLAIQNDASLAEGTQVQPGTLVVAAPVIEIGQDAQITAQATVNAPASPIEVQFGERLSIDGGNISTSAVDGNGGAIRIVGGKLVQVRRGQITTSVAGQRGNGGDIEIHADTLVLDTGFVQANTAADRAAGGDVRIDVRTLLPSGNALVVGGDAPYVFDPAQRRLNVIQAAAPTGVSGSIAISTPALDVSGSLALLNTQMLSGGELARSPCQGGSRGSLTQAGRGGFAPSARDFLGLDRPAVAMAQTASPSLVARAARLDGCVR